MVNEGQLCRVSAADSDMQHDTNVPSAEYCGVTAIQLRIRPIVRFTPNMETNNAGLNRQNKVVCGDTYA